MDETKKVAIYNINLPRTAFHMNHTIENISPSPLSAYVLFFILFACFGLCTNIEMPGTVYLLYVVLGLYYSL